MGNIIDILKAMNVWYFKIFLNDEDFGKFEEIGNVLINEFKEMDEDLLICVLDALDNIHVSCLKGNNIPAIKVNELVINFRKDIYELHNKKYKPDEKPTDLGHMLPKYIINSS